MFSYFLSPMVSNKLLYFLHFRLLIASAIFAYSGIQAQEKVIVVPPPAIEDFKGLLIDLASETMEGRELGTIGGYRAATHIASAMNRYGLIPFGNTLVGGNKSDYFQDFEVIRFQPLSASLEICNVDSQQITTNILHQGIDFEVKPCFNVLKTSAPVVFAGYGVANRDKQYNDYEGLEMEGKVAIILNGFPGHADTNSLAWKIYGKEFPRNGAKFSDKRRAAINHGAIALIIIDYNSDSTGQINHSLQESVSRVTDDDPFYHDFDYLIRCDTTNPCMPVVILNQHSGNKLMAEFGLRMNVLEKKIAASGKPASFPLPGRTGKLSIEVMKEVVKARNVVGIIRGKDTTRSIVIGAHYDHLGIRGDSIYFGADDNASGVAGMLTIAQNWAKSGLIPEQNLVFASWDGEEKGLLGSNFFVRQMRVNSQNTSLYFNMDMISRSAEEDTLRQLLSIGTRSGDTALRALAEKYNGIHTNPFVLDLWDVTGRSGSDYASFTAAGIPVMTFFSGFHNEYHTPRDVPSKTDHAKMFKILRLVNDCIQYLHNESEVK